MGLGILVFGIGMGIFCGKKFAKLRMSKLNKKLEKDAEKFTNGELENKCEIDGRIVKVNKFVLRNEDQKDETISFEGGKMVRKLKDNPQKVQEKKQAEPKKKSSVKKTSVAHKKLNKKNSKK